jgi:HD-like signal output (HDOD) protein
MGFVHIDDLTDKMVLLEDVREAAGRLLLIKGQKITLKNIEILKQWDIKKVYVSDSCTEDEEIAQSEETTEPDKLEQDVLSLFRYTDMEHPAIKELFRLSVLFRREHKLTGQKKTEIQIEPNTSEMAPTDDLMKEISAKNMKLPELPSIVFELNEIISNPLSTTDSLAQIVSKSPSLTAALLKIVNSPYYGFTSKIDTIPRAVTAIGTREVSTLALMICTLSIFKGIPENIVDMRSFLRHSFGCGLVARMLAANKNIPQTEQLLVGGLLHDIGRVIIYKYFPGPAKQLLSQCASSGNLLHKAEKIHLGCTHMDISRHLMEEWRFPRVLEDNIFHHHDPVAANKPVEAAILHLADIIVNAMGMGTSGERFVPPLSTQAWEGLGISPSSFEIVIRQAIHQFSALEPYLK